MTGLRQPPKKQDRPGRVVLRLLILIVLLALVAFVIWAATTDTLIGATEDVALDGLELDTRDTYGTMTLNVVEGERGPDPVVLLNGYDISGGVVWDGVISALPENYETLNIDLPGFGLSDRIPEPGPEHTVASMAQTVTSVIESRFEQPVVIVGAGLGGEVAAEIAVTNPDVVRGVVLIDVDFWEQGSWLQIGARLPYFGRPIAYTYWGDGRFGVSEWAPHCEEGGWCPSNDQLARRGLAATIVSSTDSLRSFLQTNPASLVPSDLRMIEAPVAYVWSSKGTVPEDSVNMVSDEMTSVFTVNKVDAWQAHLEKPSSVVDAVVSVSQ